MQRNENELESKKTVKYCFPFFFFFFLASKLQVRYFKKDIEWEKQLSFKHLKGIYMR